jgi:hypothetical protein
MKNFLSLTFTLLLQLLVFAQDTPPPKIHKENFKPNTFYLYKAAPEKNIRGVLVMIPGMTDAIYSPLFQSSLANSLNKIGYAIMIPILSDDNMHLAILDENMKNLAAMLTDLLSTYMHKRKDTPIILGGLSIGGTIAIRFYQQIAKQNQTSQFNIKRLYAVDPPLDLLRLKASLTRNKDIAQAALITEPFKLEKTLAEHLKRYSPLYETTTVGCIYTSTKSRLYCEPDVQWYIDHGMQVSDMNVVDCSAYYRQQKMCSENKVEFIMTQSRGFRQPGNVRHPHAWSIIDTDDFVKWIRDGD